MATYRCVRKLTSDEAAYLAGLIDGEGTIALTRHHPREERQLSITISNTERPLLEYVRMIVGAGHVTNKRVYQPEHTPGVTYTLNNRQALNLLEQIAPYLRTYKAERASLILRDYVRLTPRNGRYSPEQKEERTKFIEVFLNLRHNARQKISSSL